MNRSTTTHPSRSSSSDHRVDGGLVRSSTAPAPPRSGRYRRPRFRPAPSVGTGAAMEATVVIIAIVVVVLDRRSSPCVVARRRTRAHARGGAAYRAAETRDLAEVASVDADRQAAEADERAARAERERLAAEQQRLEAERRAARGRRPPRRRPTRSTPTSTSTPTAIDDADAEPTDREPDLDARTTADAQRADLRQPTAERPTLADPAGVGHARALVGARRLVPLFDFDGTLVDSDVALTAPWHALGVDPDLVPLGLPLVRGVRAGRRDRRGLPRALRPDGRPAVRRRRGAARAARPLGPGVQQGAGVGPARAGAARAGRRRWRCSPTTSAAAEKELGPLLDAPGPRRRRRSCSSATPATTAPAPPRSGARFALAGWNPRARAARRSRRPRARSARGRARPARR